jgi:hypothetical protein
LRDGREKIIHTASVLKKFDSAGLGAVVKRRTGERSPRERVETYVNGMKEAVE